MLKDVVEVQPTQDYCLRLRFEDGAEGEVDVAVLIPFEGIFSPLQDRTEFLKVFRPQGVGNMHLHQVPVIKALDDVLIRLGNRRAKLC